MSEDVKKLNRQILNNDMIIGKLTNENLKLKKKVEDLSGEIERVKNIYFVRQQASENIEILIEWFQSLRKKSQDPQDRANFDYFIEFFKSLNG